MGTYGTPYHLTVRSDCKYSVPVLCGHRLSVPSGKDLGGKIISVTFQDVYVIPIATHGDFNFPTFLLVLILIFSVTGFLVMICISLMTKSVFVWIIFLHTHVGRVYLLWRKTYLLVLSIFKSGSPSLLRNRSSLYSPDVSSSLNTCSENIFSSSTGCIVFLTGSFDTQKFSVTDDFLSLLLLLMVLCSRIHCHSSVTKAP